MWRASPALTRQETAVTPARTVRPASSRPRMRVGLRHAKTVPSEHFWQQQAPRRLQPAKTVQQGNSGMLLVATKNQPALTARRASSRRLPEVRRRYRVQNALQGNTRPLLGPTAQQRVCTVKQVTSSALPLFCTPSRLLHVFLSQQLSCCKLFAEAPGTPTPYTIFTLDPF